MKAQAPLSTTIELSDPGGEMKKYDYILVADIETTCWGGTIPDGMYPELIQFGAVELHLNEPKMPLKRAYSVYVWPKVSELNDFGKSIHGIDADTFKTLGLSKAYSFKDACQEITEVHFSEKRERLWASWGDFDRRHFEKECYTKGVQYPFGTGHINVKDLFAIAYRLFSPIGMDKAMQIMGLTFEGDRHNAEWDAYNTAKMLRQLLIKLRGTL